MRLFGIVRARPIFHVFHVLALVSTVGLLSGCPKKDSDAAPEPASTPAATSDKAGAEPAPAPAAPAATPAAKKKDDDKGGW